VTKARVALLMDAVIIHGRGVKVGFNSSIRNCAKSKTMVPMVTNFGTRDDLETFWD